jgi:hypothetical protein
MPPVDDGYLWRWRGDEGWRFWCVGFFLDECSDRHGEVMDAARDSTEVEVRLSQCVYRDRRM